MTISVADELRRIAKGEILSDSWSRDIYSVDASHYTIKPSMISCPSDESDVEKICQYCFSKSIPITARGAGTGLLGEAGPNDANDADPNKVSAPIPSGAISLQGVWLWGLGWLVVGGVLLMPLGKSTAVFVVLLTGSILLYDAIHKLVALSPLVMAGCRFFLYLVAASASVAGVTGLVIWSALVLASYIVGLSYLARKESTRARLQAWPALLLGSAKLLVPYQTESDRPGPPAAIHGNTFTFDGGRLTWTGVAHCVQFVAALATVVKTWKVLAPPLTDPATANVT